MVEDVGVGSDDEIRGRLSRVQAWRVLGEFDYDIRFGTGENRMRVIYAPNGRGKTNLLRAVNLLLNSSVESFQALVEIPIERLQLNFASGDQIELRRENAFEGSFSVLISPSDGNCVELSIDPADFAGRLYRRVWDTRSEYVKYAALQERISSGGVLIGDDRLSNSEEDPRELSRGGVAPRRRPIGSVTRLLERVERMLTQQALASLSRDAGSGGVYADITRTTLQGTRNLTAAEARQALEKQISKLTKTGREHEKYGLLSLRQVDEIRTQLFKARANSRNIPTLHRIITPYLQSMQDQVYALKPAQELIDTFVQGVNRFLDRKQLSFSTAAGIRLVGKDRQRLDPESLSSGERHLLYLLSQAVLATVDRPLLIIDEPELSLGIGWQRDLLEELLRCSASGQVQFLIASHSVQVMGGIPKGEITHPRDAL